MNIVETYLEKPHLLTSLVLLAAVIGLVGYRRMPVNLFPDSERPQIAVVTVYPGASSSDVEADVSRTIEKELNTIEEVRRVTSVSKDEVSAVMVEFEYSKGLDSAATDVANGLQKIEARLPQAIRPPMVFKVSSATPAVMTLALRPKKGSPLDLSMIRQIADNQIKERLLQLPEVANVEVFGAHQPVVRVELDRDKLESFGLTPVAVRERLMAFNANQPVGLLITSDEQFLLKRTGEFESLSEIGAITVAHRPDGDVHLADVAGIHRSVLEPQSAYHGDGKPAIAVNVQRATTGNALRTIADMSAVIPELEATYPGLEVTIPDTQGTLIELSVGNMLNALRDAVIMTVLVIFLFLADLRGMTLAAISIPFTYLLTFAVMWLIGYEFNMVTLTAVIIAVGMLLDDAIVVLENIERHSHEVGTDVHEAVVGGTHEVMLAIFSGTYATVMVLLPIIFIGGFVQTVLRPLSISLTIALIASYVVSVTVIPLLAPYLLKRGDGVGRNRFERLVYRFNEHVVDPIRDFYVRLTETALGHRGLFLIVAVVLLVVSARQMPLIGRDLMPPMDTGIVKIEFEAWPNSPVAVTEQVVAEMERHIMAVPGLVRMAAVVGAESGVISFGADRTSQEGLITVHFRNRFERKASIWQIEAGLRQSFSTIAGLKRTDVYDYGATPLSSIAAPIDVMISGPDPRLLDHLAAEVEQRLLTVRGLTTVSRSWDWSKKELAITLDEARVARYGLSPNDVSTILTTATTGRTASHFSVAAQDGYNVRLRFDPNDMTDMADLETLQVVGPKGAVPLEDIADIQPVFRQSRITRQNLFSVINIRGYRDKTAITHLQNQVATVLADIRLPVGYRITQEGEIRQMKESFSKLGLAMGLAVLFLYFSMVITFASYLRPLIIMSAIPLAFIGVPWGMLLLERHFCMPAAMGMILLTGIVVNNSILLVDFIETAMENGETLQTAIEQAISRRTRPILMTALSTVAGMLPVAAQSAVGLERLSPLAVVAIAGLLVSTFLTLAWVPTLYIGIAWLKGKLQQLRSTLQLRS